MARSRLLRALFVLLMLVALTRAVEWPPAMRGGTSAAGFVALVCAALIVGGAAHGALELVVPGEVAGGMGMKHIEAVVVP